MFKKLSQILLGAWLTVTCYGQNRVLIVPKYVRIPADSARREELINSLNGFLAGISRPNKDNLFIEAGYLPETSALLDEIKGVDDANAGKAGVCRCYLTNVAVLDSAGFLIQLSYLGLNDSTPLLQASFRLMASLQGNRYVFRSPLRRNTATWSKKQVGAFVLFYTAPFNEAGFDAYRRKAEEFDQKLGAKAYRTELYCCNTAQEGLEMLGVDYKVQYNGYSSLALSSFEDNISLNVLGISNADPTLFDLHDCWHDRLHRVMPVGIINKPIDEGCAYLYAGSWGLSWPEIYKQFRSYMEDKKDWLTVFNENKNFAATRQYHLYAAYVIDALLVKKIEKEKGFPAVMEFLGCGRYEAGNDNYFRALDKIIGINRANFNVNVERLVEEE